MAAEAFLVYGNGAPKTGDDYINALVAGNDHASRFPEALAKQFADQWEVVDQCPNTKTGLSGTLFRNRANPSELVISFRSTEFVDDSAHDNQATNAMEIADRGWAFGQIADMEDWYKQLKDQGKIPAGSPLTVTGYSLGGHLATAFNLLRQEDATKGIQNPISNTYTFNGAGVGSILQNPYADDPFDPGNTPPPALKTLTGVIANFNNLRANAASLFSDPNAKALYETIKSSPTLTSFACTDYIAAAQRTISTWFEQKLIVEALTRIRTIVDETLRLQTLSSGDGKTPKQVSVSDIAQLGIDYQLGVIVASRDTSAVSKLAGGGYMVSDSRNTIGPISGFYDVYAATYPSMVASSQNHYGAPTPIYIEDQPLYRGTVIGDSVKASLDYADVKLLVDGYVNNDFGDTHSLVLMVDSLSLMNVFYQMDNSLTLEKMALLFKSATASSKESISGSQGKAEGDTLETVLDGLYKFFTGEDKKLREGQAGQQRINILQGNTWANPEMRKAFYDVLAVVQTKIGEGLAGKATVDVLASTSAAMVISKAKGTDGNAVA